MIVLPLADVRVVAVEQYGAGPFGSMQLAELGADIIKIEDPSLGGDIARGVPPFAEGQDSLFFESLNRGKRSLSLDLANPSGREVFEDLVRNADAVFSNLRGDVPAKLRLRYVDLEHINPQIVCCSLSGYGMTGPRSADPTYDYIIQGLTGWMSLTGEPEGPPAKSGLSLVDFSGGFVAAIAVLTGIHAARRDGIGMECDVSLFDTSMSLLTYLSTWHLTRGYEPQRMARSAHPSLVPFQVFPASDGWFVVGCAKEKFWHRLASVIGRQDLIDDPRFKTFVDRDENRAALQEILDEAFAARTVEEWVSILRAAAVPCGPVNNVADAMRDEQTLARELVVSTPHPRFGEVRHVRSPVRVGPLPKEVRRAPSMGEHTAEVLQGVLGYDDPRISGLRSQGAFGPREDSNRSREIDL